MRSLLFLFLATSSLYAQQHEDTLFLRTAINNTAALYAQVIKGQTTLYNGSQYRRLPESDNGHPFFRSDDWEFGSVTYNGQYYENVPLLYDVLKDQIITESYNGSEMVLTKEKVSRFNLNDDIFITVHHPSLPKAGFYQLLYDGPSRALAKRQKGRREKISDRSIEVFFDTRDRFFIYKNGLYFQVRNKSGVLRVFGNKKTELKEFFKTNHVRFKADFARALKLAAEKYDALNVSE